MESSDRIRVLELSLDRQLRWIAAADAKLAFAFGVETAMLGVLAVVSPKDLSTWTIASAIAAPFAAALAVASLLFLSFAAFPRTKGPRGSLIFFGGIAQKEADAFKAEVSALEEPDYVEDLAVQCHRNAEIAERKFAWIQRALLCLYVGTLPWALALFLLYGVEQAARV